MEAYINIFIFIFGLLIGSFLNVIIYRLPINESIVYPRSKCPGCGKLIKWYQNLPVISYLLLRGKCEVCGYKIPVRYPLIELLTGGLALYIINPDQIAVSFFLFNVACVLVSIFFIDLDHKIIPDKLNLYLLLLFLAYSLIYTSPYFWLVGGAIGFLGPLAITWLFYKLRNQVGLGGGDIKLFGVLGIYLGPVGIMSNIFMSSFIGAFVGVVLIALKRFDAKNTLAFGPYIVIVAFIQIFFPKLFSMINPFAF